MSSRNITFARFEIAMTKSQHVDDAQGFGDGTGR